MAARSKSSTGNGPVRTSASACRCAPPAKLPQTAAPREPRPMRPRPGSIAILGLAMAGLLAGCAGLTSPRERGPADALPTTEAIQAAQVNSLLSALARVVAGTPTEQAEIMAEARMAYEQARQGPAALRYGLLLAAP